MGRKKNNSYEETHRKLVEAMQEACVRDDFDDYPDPDIDISFIYEDMEAEPEFETVIPEPEKKRFRFSSRFNKVAAIIVVLLLSGNLIMLATDSGDSYGHKGLLHRLVMDDKGIFTDENTVQDDEIVEQHCFKSEDELKKAEDLFVNSYSLEYIPEGYNFENLELTVYASEDMWALYKYNNSLNYFTVGFFYNNDFEEKYYIHSIKENVEDEIILNDRKIYLYEDSIENLYVADVYFEDCMVDISGLSNKNEIIKIAENIKKNTH